MKKLLFNNLKPLVLLAITSFTFIISSYEIPDSEDNPCDPIGSNAWDGYNCHCKPGFTGLCCEVPLEPDPGFVSGGCSINPLLTRKKNYITCSMTISGDAILESKLKKLIKVEAGGKGQLSLEFENFAYDCTLGRELFECQGKDCSTALREILSSIQ